MDDKQTNLLGGVKKQSGKRVVGLDLLRISLALLIFMFHSHIHVLHCDYGVLNNFINMGAVAMTGFFLLSGYALSLSTIQQKFTDEKVIKTFYLKRFISIIPLYYAWALINITINTTLGGMNSVIEEFLLFPIESLGLQSIFASLFQFSHNGGSWFISCILICYFLFPFIRILTNGISNKARIKIVLILCCLLLWSPIIRHYFHTVDIYANPFFRLFEFVIGAIVCQINLNTDNKNKVVNLLRTPLACLISVCLLIVGVSVAYRIGIPHDFMLYNWVALPCFISLLLSLGYIKFEVLQGSKFIKYMSAISFSIFLSQLKVVWRLVKFLMVHAGCDSNILNILVSATFCFILANCFHFLIEKPSSKYLKAKFLNK